jgi:hypothetical protein
LEALHKYAVVVRRLAFKREFKAVQSITVSSQYRLQRAAGEDTCPEFFETTVQASLLIVNRLV